MNHKGIWTIFLKDLKSSYKNKLMLLIILMPIVISVAMGSAMNAMVAESQVPPVAVYDQGDNADFIKHLNSTGIYAIQIAESAEALRAMIDKGDAAAGIVLPPGFTADLQNGTRPSINITVDSSNLKSAMFLLTYKDAIMEFAGAQYPVNISIESTKKRSSLQFSVITWIVFAVVLVGIQILPHTLTTEKEKKTLDAVLTSPISESDVILGKSLYGVFITVLISVLILIINNGLTGNVPLTLAFIVLGSITFTGIGLLIASITNTYNSASIASAIVMMPFMVLSILGSLSKQLETASYLSPGTYMEKGISEAMLHNAVIGSVWLYMVVLIAVSIVIYALAVFFIKKRRSVP